MVRCSFSNHAGEHDHRDLHKVYLELVLFKQSGNIYTLTFKNKFLNFQFNSYLTPIVIPIKWNIIKHIILSQMIVLNTDTSRGRHRSLRRFWKGGGIEPRKHYCACSVEFSRLDRHSSDFCVVFIMKALRGMVSGAVSEISSAVIGSKHVAVRENVLAVTRDYISQPRLSEWPVLTMKGPYKQKPIPVAMCVCRNEWMRHLHCICQSSSSCYYQLQTFSI